MIETLKNKLHNKINRLKSSKNIFLIACCVYFFNSVGNIGQGVFIKYFIKNEININLYEFMCFRCFVGILILLPFNIANIRKYFKISHSFFFLNIIISIFYTLDIFLWNLGLQTINVNSGTIIMLLIPIWISILSRVLLKEKDFSIFHLISLILGFCGVIVSIHGEIKFSHINYGYFIILLNTFNVAVGLILQKKFRHERPVLYALFLNALVSFIFFFIINHFEISYKKTVTLDNLVSFLKNKDLIFMTLIITFFDIMEYAAVYIAYSMYNVSSLQPVRFTRILVSAVLSYLLLNEKITLHQFIAISIIITANTIIPIKKKFFSRNNNK